MANAAHNDKGILRAKLEFPVWYRGFTKSYAAWSNAPTDLKAPLLLAGSALAKAESWLLACPAKLSDSQKRFIVRSISQGARQGSGGAANSGAGSSGRARWRWHRSSDRPLWHLYAIIALGIWVFAPDFISDALESALNEPEVREELRRERAAVAGKTETASKAGTTTEPEKSVAAASPEVQLQAEVAPAMPELPAVAVAPPTPVLSPAERLARLAQEQLTAGQGRAGLLLAIEAAEMSRTSGVEPTAGVLLPLQAALATREKLAPLVRRDLVTTSALICQDGRTAITISNPGEASVWRGGQAKVIAGVAIAGLDNVGVDRECRRLLVANLDFNVEIRSLATGAKLAELGGHEASVLTAAFSPDGNSVVTGAQDGTARLWDARTGRQRALLSGHDWHVVAAEFSPDGRRVLTASEDKTARVWDAATGRGLFQLGGHQGAVTSARYAALGALIVTTSWDGFVRLYEAATGKLLSTLRLPQGNLGVAQVSRNGRWLATTDTDGPSHLWEISGRYSPVQITAFPGETRSIAFSPDSRWLAVVDWAGQARLYPTEGGSTESLSTEGGSTEGGRAAMTFGGGTDRIHGLVFSPGSNSLEAITEAGIRLGWPLPETLERTLAQARSIAPACLTVDERTLLGLDADVPAWCSEIKPRGARLP